MDDRRLVFSKHAMIERLIREGRSIAITRNVVKSMDNLDGQPATPLHPDTSEGTSNIYVCLGKDGKPQNVNAKDCIIK